MDIASISNILLAGFGGIYALTIFLAQTLTILGAILSGHSHEYLVNGQWVNIIQTA